MPPILTGEKVREGWLSRYEASRAQVANPNKLAAALAVVIVVAELLLAQLTLVLTACFWCAGWLTRWRSLWLICPAAAGLTWMLTIGIRPAAAGYLAVAAHFVRGIAGHEPAAGSPPGLVVAGGWPAGLTGLGHLVPRQLPLALVVAAGQALALRRRGSRPGLLAATRRAYVIATLRRGEVATPSGGCLGVISASGKRLEVTWQQALGGVLCTGRERAAVTATGRDLACAAIQHRKAVIIVDLDGADGLREAIAAVCVSAGAPLIRLGSPAEHGSGCYQPWAGLSPDQAASLVIAMIDWSPFAQARRPFCADYLATALALAGIDEAGAAGPGRGMTELARLLRPGGLEAGLRRAGLQASHPLARRVADLSGQLDADPESIALIAGQFGRLAASPLGRQLSPSAQRAATPPASSAIGLRRVMTDRDVVLFSLDRAAHGGAAAMIARLVIADLAAALTERRAAGVPADCLAWINGCEAVGRGQLDELIGIGAVTGTCVVLGTASGACASAAAGSAGVLAVRGQAPAGLDISDVGDFHDHGLLSALCAERRPPAETRPSERAASAPAEGPAAITMCVRAAGGSDWRLVTGRAVR